MNRSRTRGHRDGRRPRHDQICIGKVTVADRLAQPPVVGLFGETDTRQVTATGALKGAGLAASSRTSG